MRLPASVKKAILTIAVWEMSLFLFRTFSDALQILLTGAYCRVEEFLEGKVDSPWTRDGHLDYLRGRGWLLGEYDDATSPGDTQVVAQDPVDERHYPPPTALSIQLLRDIKRIGSYKEFVGMTGFDGEEEFAGEPEVEPEAQEGVDYD